MAETNGNGGRSSSASRLNTIMSAIIISGGGYLIHQIDAKQDATNGWVASQAYYLNDQAKTLVKLEQSIADRDAEGARRGTAIDQHFDTIDRALGGSYRRVDIDRDLVPITGRLDKVERRVDGLEQHLPRGIFDKPGK